MSNGRNIGIGAAVVAVTVAVAAGVATTSGGSGDGATPTQAATPAPVASYAALQARKAALDAKLGLDRYGKLGEPDWLRALRIRSEALNRMYGLGDYATK